MSMRIKTFLRSFKSGSFNAPDAYTQIKAGWVGWLCEDKEIKGKTEYFAKILKETGKSGAITRDHYIFFKNTCPNDHLLYDVIGIKDNKNMNHIYVLLHNADFLNSKWAVFDHIDDFQEPIHLFQSDDELFDWFQTGNAGE